MGLGAVAAGLRGAAEGGSDGRAEVTAGPSEGLRADLSRHAFGAQFAEVRRRADTGEVRVPRLLGVFAAGQILNPMTAARSSSAA